MATRPFPRRLEAGGAAALSGYSTLNAVSVANGATLIVPTGNGVNGWSSSQINTLLQNVSLAPTSILGLDTSSGNATYSGAIPVAVSKVGPNTLSLTGTGAFGPLTVTAGAVAFPNPTATVGPLSGG